MNIDLATVKQWMLVDSETENLEFKEASKQFDFGKLLEYCCAIANEGGGYLLLGISNKKPRRITGSAAFPNLLSVKKDLLDRLRILVDTEEIFDEDQKRVVVFIIPSRTIGNPLHVGGSYFMRAGESLESMTGDRLKKIFDESQPDYSGIICKGAELSDLEPISLEKLKTMWSSYSNNQRILSYSDVQILNDLELAQNTNLTIAAVILLGNENAVRRLLPQAEVIFEYRDSANSVGYQSRKEYKGGFLSFIDDLWNTINTHNKLQSVNLGLQIQQIPMFMGETVREGLLNALCHRDYRDGNSIVIRQSSNKLEIVSPGGFPAGINAENIIVKQNPRNRRLAEVLSKCGLVERSGQGVDKMFRESIVSGKQPPDFSETNEYQVRLALEGAIDPDFLRFFVNVNEKQIFDLSTLDIVVLDLVHREQQIPEYLHKCRKHLLEINALEYVGQTRGKKYILSRQLYTQMGQKGTYTRKKGIDKNHQKALIESHFQHHKTAVISDLEQVLPEQTRSQIQKILQTLQKEGKVRRIGQKRGSYWESTARFVSKPIPSAPVFKGTRYSSVLKAQWAIFFENLGVQWQFAPTTYMLSDLTGYSPDFQLILPDMTKVYCEVQSDDFDDFDEGALERLRQFSTDFNAWTLLLTGPPSVRVYQLIRPNIGPDALSHAFFKDYNNFIGIVDEYWMQALIWDNSTGRARFDLDERAVRKSFGRKFVAAIRAAKELNLSEPDLNDMD